jgi:hypothetical protein
MISLLFILLAGWISYLHRQIDDANEFKGRLERLLRWHVPGDPKADLLDRIGSLAHRTSRLHPAEIADIKRDLAALRLVQRGGG